MSAAIDHLYVLTYMFLRLCPCPAAPKNTHKFHYSVSYRSNCETGLLPPGLPNLTFHILHLTLQNVKCENQLTSQVNVSATGGSIHKVGCSGVPTLHLRMFQYLNKLSAAPWLPPYSKVSWLFFGTGNPVRKSFDPNWGPKVSRCCSSVKPKIGWGRRKLWTLSGSSWSRIRECISFGPAHWLKRTTLPHWGPKGVK